MNPQGTFNEILKTSIYPLVKEFGYSRKALTFYRKHEGNWALINFQKSVQNTSETLKFTINCGVASTKILEFLPPPQYRVNDPNSKPTILDCHWSQRVGFLLPEQSDKWWIIDKQGSGLRLSQELTESIKIHIIPILEKLISDEALSNLWLDKLKDGRATTGEIIYLTILLRNTNATTEFSMALNELEKRAADPRKGLGAQVHLERLKRET